MKVRHFNPKDGLYWFDIEVHKSELHSHPIVEICFSELGALSIKTDEDVVTEVSLAIVPANLAHRIESLTGSVQVIMLENRSQCLTRILADLGWVWRGELMTIQGINEGEDLLQSIAEAVLPGMEMDRFDFRIQQCCVRLATGEVNYRSMLSELAEIVHLSESRLSHLFKEEVGVSIQRYLLWCRLRRTIQDFIDGQEDLLAAALDSGFYDQAHFGRTFKQFMGISPAKVYNSGIVQ